MPALTEALVISRSLQAVYAGVLVLAVTSAACTGAARAVSSATTPTPAPELLATREAAWRAYFAGDEVTLGALLPADFIGLDMGPGPFGDRAKTLAGAREFHASGGRLVRLEFPETRAQRYGDVVVLYGRFEVVLETGGEQRSFRGRLTEVFVWRDGRWSHPGWHLDLIE
jgi:hypothetical protein